MGYAEHLPKTLPGPLQGPNGKKYFRAVGRRMDSLVQLFREAVLARLPNTAPSDALPEIGQERGLPKGSGESNAAWSARLVDAWDAWGGDDSVGGGGGSHFGMLKQIALLGLPTGTTGVTIVQQNGRYSQLDGSGNLVIGTLMNCVNRMDLTGVVNSRAGWTFEGRDNFYSEFGIVFPADVGALRAGTATAAKLNEVVEKWRPAKALYVGCWVIQTGRTLGWPTGRTCGTDPNLGGNTIYFIPGSRGDHTRIGYSP